MCVCIRLQQVQFQEKKKTSCTKLPALDKSKYNTYNNCKTHCVLIDYVVIKNAIFCFF